MKQDKEKAILSLRDKLEKLKCWEELNKLDKKMVETFKKMTMIELATIENELAVKKAYPEDYQKYIQARHDTHMFKDESHLEDLQAEVKHTEEMLKIHQASLAKYNAFYQRYATIFGSSNLEDDYKQNPEQKAKNDLIKECMDLIFPNITPELEPLMRAQFENKSLNELADIASCFKMDEERHPKV